MFPMRPLVALVMGTLWKILRTIPLSSFLSPLSGVNLTDEKPLKEGGSGRPALRLENTGELSRERSAWQSWPWEGQAVTEMKDFMTVALVDVCLEDQIFLWFSEGDVETVLWLSKRSCPGARGGRGMKKIRRGRRGGRRRKKEERRRNCYS